MASKVFKYAVPIDDQWHQIDLPIGAYITHVDVAHDPLDNVYFWAVVDHPQEFPQERSFRVYGTGQKLPDRIRVIGTCLVANGRLVWHLIERIR